MLLLQIVHRYQPQVQCILSKLLSWSEDESLLKFQGARCISDIGGLLGIFIGISIISLMEVFDLLVKIINIIRSPNVVDSERPVSSTDINLSYEDMSITDMDDEDGDNVDAWSTHMDRIVWKVPQDKDISLTGKPQPTVTWNIPQDEEEGWDVDKSGNDHLQNDVELQGNHEDVNKELFSFPFHPTRDTFQWQECSSMAWSDSDNNIPLDQSMEDFQDEPTNEGDLAVDEVDHDMNQDEDIEPTQEMGNQDKQETDQDVGQEKDSGADCVNTNSRMDNADDEQAFQNVQMSKIRPSYYRFKLL